MNGTANWLLLIAIAKRVYVLDDHHQADECMAITGFMPMQFVY